MTDEVIENLDSPNETAEEAVNTEQIEEISTEETTEDLDKLKESRQRIYDRAKAAEAREKELKAKLKVLEPKPVSEPKPYDLEDVAVLVSTVPEKEDREVVKRYAKVEGKTLEETLNDPIVKAILKERAEQRKTADATNTSGSKRVTAKLSDEAIINKAANDEFVDAEDVVEARWNLKKKNKGP